jgi:hypothetical protein
MDAVHAAGELDDFISGIFWHARLETFSRGEANRKTV